MRSFKEGHAIFILESLERALPRSITIILISVLDFGVSDLDFGKSQVSKHHVSYSTCIVPVQQSDRFHVSQCQLIDEGKYLSIRLDVIAHRDSIILSWKIFERTDVSEMNHRPMLGSPAALNTITPCAACKLLRKRCAEECQFFPYFSPLEPEKFEYVHRVFGASNVCRMISEVPESKREETANTLVYEANARIRDPVYGSTRIIYSLQQWALAMQVELNAVKAAIMTHNCRDPVLPPLMFSVYDFNSGGFKVTNPMAGTVSSVDHREKQRYFSVMNHNRFSYSNPFPNPP